jgi:PadR family transcriptional regulator, regulatory protein PadR
VISREFEIANHAVPASSIRIAWLAEAHRSEREGGRDLREDLRVLVSFARVSATRYRLTDRPAAGYVEAIIAMSRSDPALSYTGLFVLQALARGYRFGFDVMDATGLPSGTVYPALRRLEALELVTSDWESGRQAQEHARPRRRYYELTAAGRRRLGEAETRYRALGKLFPRKGST